MDNDTRHASGAGVVEWESPFPAFQFYPRDWIISTRTLSAEQRGIFIDLLCFAWDQDGIPSDPATLAALVGLPPRRFNAAWEAVKAKWVDAEDGKLRNPRQEVQRAEYIELREKRRRAGQARGAQQGGSK